MATKIKAENVSVIFGKRLNEAKKLLDQGVGKDEILKKTGCTVGVNRSSFEVQEGEIFVIMGLSGSGKSTLLRTFNRLITATEGEIIVGDHHVNSLNETQLRRLRRADMSMVFQHFGLLPHRSVSSNVAFGLEIQGVSQEKRIPKAYEVIKTVGLDGYEEKMTGELSGGMQQRVGLARALCTDPEILLMDEAFSALDPLIRSNMQDELLDLQSKVKKTILFITHDLDEALKLGDRIAIMKDGVIVQIGTPEDILTSPADDYVKAFVENVDRKHIVTASTVMFDNPERVRVRQAGPNLALRKMRNAGVTSLPVVDKDNKFLGFVKDDDMVKLQQQGISEITAEHMYKNVNTVSAGTPVADLLPEFLDMNLNLAVVDEEKQLIGVVVHSSVIAEMLGSERDEIIEVKKSRTSND